MKIHELLPLPYDKEALEPIISKETLHFHHDKHHQSYVTQLNKLLPGSGFENASLDEIVLKATGPLFDQAAQHWNHHFYWDSMHPRPSPLSLESELGTAVLHSFGSLEQFKKIFEKMGSEIFGSGWLWLVANVQKQVRILATKDAWNPMRDGWMPLFVCDVWEHAYYIDYRNDRARHLEKFQDIIHWDFAEQNYARPHFLSPSP